MQEIKIYKRGLFNIYLCKISNAATMKRRLSMSATRKSAFTLSEVLVTLVIIGIIAAITVPMMLMANYRKHETSARLKKFYSNLSNAVRLAEIDRGSPLRDDYMGEGNSLDNSTFWEDNLGKYLPAVKTNINYERTCTPGADSGGGVCQTYNPVYMLNDGSMIIYYWHHKDYGQFGIDFDVNGMKKPNMYGKDIFRFKIQGPSKNCNYQTKVFAGWSCGNTHSRSFGIANCPYTVTACSELIMLDGWEFKDDYPTAI